MRFTAGAAGLTAVVMVALAGCGTPAATGSESPERGASASTAPEREDARLSSAELQGRWWTWAASEPEATNPVADTDGSACGRNQPHDVWFLAGTFGGQVKRACEVPGGRPIAAPVVNLLGDPQDCAAFMSGARGTVLLDGEAVEPETHEGDPITVRGAPGNPLTREEGNFAVTGCGLWVQLPPLAPGKHSLKIRGREGDFSTSVDYTLTVTAPPDRA
ncbi:signal protein [Streptomyces termitum]